MKMPKQRQYTYTAERLTRQGVEVLGEGATKGEALAQVAALHPTAELRPVKKLEFEAKGQGHQVVVAGHLAEPGAYGVVVFLTRELR
jgi:hypothetical protein